MQRTNIYLEDRQTVELDRLAREEGVSRAEIVRRLIDRALQGHDDQLEHDLRKIDLAFGVDATVEVPDRAAGDRESHLEQLWRS